MTTKKLVEVAKRFFENSRKAKELELALSADKTLLRSVAAGETIYLPELDGKVVVDTPTETTNIDAAALAKTLLTAGRVDELLLVIGITKAALVERLIDGAELAKKFGTAGPVREGTVKATTLSMADKKKLLESK